MTIGKFELYFLRYQTLALAEFKKWNSFFFMGLPTKKVSIL